MIVAVMLVGCASWPDTLSRENRQKLSQLRLEMTMDEVASLMGTEPIHRRVNQPYRTETTRLSDGTSAVIWLYYSDIKARDDAITNDELTPVVFEKGKVVGWGWTYLDQNYNRYKIKIDR